MTKLHSKKLAFIGLLITFCYLNGARIQARNKTPGQPTPPKQPVVKPAPKLSIIVGSIGDYTITKEELEKRLLMEMYPHGYDSYDEKAQPPEAKAVLLNMLAEKAMITEVRKKGSLKDEALRASIERYKERRLVNLLLQKQLEPKLKVTESEIQQVMKSNPKFDRTRAEAMIKNAKGRRLFELYYKHIYQKFHAKKLSQNFPKAVQIHQRLLTQPKKPRKVPFIRTYQITEELTTEEKNMVLAEYDTGKVTLQDWFKTLCDSAPPSRPKDLNTPEGVEKLLDRAMRMPLLVLEAKSLKVDEDKDLIKQVKDYEDGRLLSKVKTSKYKETKEPTKEQIMAYYDKNKEAFITNRTLKVDVIWCQDLKTAEKVKAEVNEGGDFEAVKQKYSLNKKSKPFNTYPSSEGLFWKDLWKGDPNDILGPVKGFNQNSVKWRIVKILEKKPGEVKEYSDDMERRIKDRILSEQREALIAQYGSELLKKYPYKIHQEKIKDIDPLDIP
jgi:hypothetical protein